MHFFLVPWCLDIFAYKNPRLLHIKWFQADKIEFSWKFYFNNNYFKKVFLFSTNTMNSLLQELHQAVLLRRWGSHEEQTYRYRLRNRLLIPDHLRSHPNSHPALHLPIHHLNRCRIRNKSKQKCIHEWVKLFLDNIAINIFMKNKYQSYSAVWN